MLIEQFFDAGLGHASYLVADPDAGVAFVVDPDRNVDTYLDAAARLGVLVTDSFETHVHNDYVSGSRALAEARPITVHAGNDAELAYPHASHADGELIAVGELSVRCVATPGHTPEHVAYLVADLRRSDDPPYLFSRGAPTASRKPLALLHEIAPDAIRIDPRPPHVFGAGHRPRALNVVGNDSFAVRIGATVAFGAPIVILTADAEQAERLRGQLAVVGYDDVRGYASPHPGRGEGALPL